mmetsp:Transcript_32391/g.84786  ORF Transcript_32391/g.84786 Transcript_32391/m.84786 type:complete len:339 (+) Transcript_32391:1-1017(+)
MQYRESEGWIHGDLACRNVLINALQVCQVADFGLSKFQGLDIENNGRDEEGKMTGRVTLKEKKLKYVKYNTQYPVRWVSPEVIAPGSDGKAKRHFSHKSDVWAFGITMYEIFTAAETPYSRVTDPRYTADGPMRNKNVKKFVLDGHRLECPDECDSVFFDQVIKPCWAERPKNRPSFQDLNKLIEMFLKRALKNHTSRKVRFKTHLSNRVTVKGRGGGADGKGPTGVAKRIDAVHRDIDTNSRSGNTSNGNASVEMLDAPYNAASSSVEVPSNAPTAGVVEVPFNTTEAPYSAPAMDVIETPYHAASDRIPSTTLQPVVKGSEAPYDASTSAYRSSEV